MFEHGSLWSVATILGPLLLLAAMVYGVVMYSRRGPASKQQSEESTRMLYREGSQRERREEMAQGPVTSPPLAPGVSSRAKHGSQDWQEARKARDTR
jgi:hypothetical protein